MPDHEALYQIAEQQGGYFSAAQAREAGFSYSLLSYHVRNGRFERVRPRVYRLVQFPASPHEDLHVAALQAGPEAVISHDSALAWPKTLIRQGLTREVRITHLGELPKKASVTGFAYFRTVVPAQMQKKGLSDSN